MSVQVYVTFNGNCREAVTYYADVFGTEKPKIMTYGEAPPNPDFALPGEAKELVLHTRLTIGGSLVMFSDAYPGMPFVQGNNISLTYLSDDIDEIKSVFGRLSEGGDVAQELQETFWSKCYGSLTDKFGIAWQFSLGEEQ